MSKPQRRDTSKSDENDNGREKKPIITGLEEAKVPENKEEEPPKEEKNLEKPDFMPSGILAKFTNSVKYEAFFHDFFIVFHLKTQRNDPEIHRTSRSEGSNRHLEDLSFQRPPILWYLSFQPHFLFFIDVISLADHSCYLFGKDRRVLLLIDPFFL